VRVKDVGRTELGADAGSHVILNGKPGVALGVNPSGGTSPKELSRAMADKIAKLRARVPEGVRLEIAFDFTRNMEAPGAPKTAEYLLLDLDLKETGSADHVRETLTRCDKLVRDIAGVQDALAMAENPFDILRDQPCILVRLAPADTRKISREEIIRNMRANFDKNPDAVLRVRDLSRRGAFPRCGYPIDLALCAPEADGPEKLRELAEKFAGRMQKSDKLTDVWANQETTPRPRLQVSIDRAQAKDRGVSIDDIFSILQVTLGSYYVNNFNEFGRTWQLDIPAAGKFGKRADDLKQIKIRNSEGKMVPLATVVTMKTTTAPAAILRLDMMPAVHITANPAADVSPAEARKLCATLFDQARKELRLPSEYKLTWFQEIPASK
jgi:multidrug efflux pump